MNLLLNVLRESWHLLLDASVFILFGLLVGGLLHVFLKPSFVAAHLGQGRFLSVFKAALFGIPLPLCSCGVLPAAASLKRQGANNGATTAFLISTPESGVDSISISWALLDPVLTVARPVAAFVSAVVAGIAENLLHHQEESGWRQVVAREAAEVEPGDGAGLSFGARLLAGCRYAATELWGDLAGWFFAGLLLAGVIAALFPAELMGRYLGGGLPAMLIMLLVGIPMYICATASTPVAAALILKGVSPGAALVFLLVGPATNVASLSVLFGLLGRRATAVYLLSLALCAVGAGLLVDMLYAALGISAVAVVGEAAELVPAGLQMAAALLLLALSVVPLARLAGRFLTKTKKTDTGQEGAPTNGCKPVAAGRAPS